MARAKLKGEIRSRSKHETFNVFIYFHFHEPTKKYTQKKKNKISLRKSCARKIEMCKFKRALKIKTSSGLWNLRNDNRRWSILWNVGKSWDGKLDLWLFFKSQEFNNWKITINFIKTCFVKVYSMIFFEKSEKCPQSPQKSLKTQNFLLASKMINFNA